MVKNLCYDALNYWKQKSAISKIHRECRDLQGDEYISGFSKSDRLKPVITLTIYFGTEKWDAPRDLYEMLSIQDKDVLKYVSNYKLNLLEPYRIEDFTRYKTELRHVFRLLSVANNKDEWIRSVLEDDDFHQISADTVRTINAVMKTPLLKR